MLGLTILSLFVLGTAGQTDIQLQSQLIGSQFTFSNPRNSREKWISFEYLSSLHFLMVADPADVLGNPEIMTYFNVVPGLCGSGVSFQLRKYPDFFLKAYLTSEGFHSVFASKLETTNTYRRQACFKPKRGRYNTGSKDPLVTFESIYWPGRYMYRDAIMDLTYDDGSSRFAEYTTFRFNLQKEGLTFGQWVLIGGYNNPQVGDKIEYYKEQGTEATDHTSTTVTRQHSWGYNLDNGGSVFGQVMKGVFTYGGVSSSETVQTSTFMKYDKSSTTTTLNMTPGIPFYLFQWHFNLYSEDGVWMDAYSNIFYSHDKITAPPDPSMLKGYNGQFH